MVKRVPLFETWMLLHHVDGTGGMHAELSRPLGIGDDGHVVGWRDRILLDLDPPEDSGAIDIPVSMKGG